MPRRRFPEPPAPGQPPEPPSDPESVARALCLRLLSSQPRTRAELAEALERKNVPVEAAAAVLDRFGEVGLIDDAAFASAWVESRHHGRGLARRALAQELRNRGIDAEVAQVALGQVGAESEESTARALIARKLASTRGLPVPNRMRRLVGLLARKGYPPGLAMRVVREAIAAEGTATEGELEVIEASAEE
ncbi:MAG: regulatory protein [Cryptosporangiaceae bacterium]|nr:regulatory protein [Cryptosporangiaceae bacterium]